MDYEAAKRDFKKCLKIDQNNRDAIKYLDYIKTKQREVINLERSNSGETNNQSKINGFKLNTMTFDFTEDQNIQDFLNKKRYNK